MKRLAHVTREHREAGPLNTLLALWGFVDDTTFLTKAGHVGVMYRVRGIDAEGLTDAQRQVHVRRIAAALRLLDEHVRVSQYLIRRVVEPFVAPPCAHPVARAVITQRTAALNSRRTALYTLEHYLVLVYEASTRARTSTTLRAPWRAPREALRDWLSERRTHTVIAAELDRAVATLHAVAQTVEVQLRELGLTRLAKAACVRFVRQLVNDDATAANGPGLTDDTHLDSLVADSPVECYGDHLRVGARRVQVLTMKEAPSQTYAHVLADLLTVPGERIVCLEWQRIPTDRMRRDLQARRRHFFNARVSVVNYLAPDARADEMLVDDSASAMVRRLGDALTALEVDGHVFGACSLTVVLHGTDARALAQQTAEVQKVLAAHDGRFIEETYNRLHAWLAVVPGNGAYNLRRLALLDTNAADLSLLFTLDTGDTLEPHLGLPALAVFETPQHTPYAFHLHVRDVGHTLVLGATGSGKSFLLNFLVTHAQQYAPRTVILDLGRSYRTLAGLLDGRYLELGLEPGAVTINPFALDPTPEQLHFLHAFVRVLLEGDAGAPLGDAEDREVYEAVTNCYVLDRPQRRLGTLAHLLPRPLSARLQPWVEGGRYGRLFDHVDDTLTLERFQVFECEAMRAYPALLEPLLFYILHRVTTAVQDPAEAGTLKLCVLDEAWRFIQHPTLRAYVREALKTWRKRNAAMILATQAIDDFASADLLRTVIESCPTTLLLANPAVDRAQYAELLHLTDRALDLLTGLLPRQEILLVRPDLTKVLTLRVDPALAWVYSHAPVDPARLAALREALVSTPDSTDGLETVAIPRPRTPITR